MTRLLCNSIRLGCVALLVLPSASLPAAAQQRGIELAQVLAQAPGGGGSRVPPRRGGSRGGFIPKGIGGILLPAIPDIILGDETRPRRPRPRTEKPAKPRKPRPEVAKPRRPRVPPRVSVPLTDPAPDRIAPRNIPRRIQRAAPRIPASQQAEPRQILVLVSQDQPATVEADLARQHRLQQIGSRPIPLIEARAALYRIRDRRTEQQVIAALTADNRVQQVQRNYRYRREAGPGGGAARLVQYGHLKVELPSAHLLAQGRNVVIAVIDSAVDANHPDLKGAISQSLDAGAEPDKVPDFHGTAVAGIIRARGLIEGVAPAASILAIRAFRVARPGALPETNSWVLLNAVELAVTNRANILNLSFAGPHDPSVHKILQAAAQRRVVSVAAAGNGGPKAAPVYPAAYPEVIAVTAIDERDRLYKHANRGSYISISAPGVDILAPVEKGKHSYLSGTSFATAYVSGIVALLLERSPGLEPASVAELISNGAEDLGPDGRDDQFGAGRINALHTLQAVTKMSAEK